MEEKCITTEWWWGWFIVIRREREKERWQMERDDSWSIPSGRPYHSYTSNLINVFSDYPEQASSNQIDFKTRWQRRDQETAVIMVWQKVFFLITPNDFQTALHKKAWAGIDSVDKVCWGTVSSGDNCWWAAWACQWHELGVIKLLSFTRNIHWCTG